MLWDVTWGTQQVGRLEQCYVVNSVQVSSEVRQLPELLVVIWEVVIWVSYVLLRIGIVTISRLAKGHREASHLEGYTEGSFRVS